jgi:inhibitor of KinA
MEWNYPILYPAGNNAITIELGPIIDVATNKKIIQLFQFIQLNKPAWLLDLIPSYCSLTLVYHPLRVIDHFKKQSAYDAVKAHLITLVSQPLSIKQSQQLVKIPACYHPGLAPDLEELAKTKNLSVQEIIDLHSTTTYRVYMIGFLPGFPYMASVDERIRVPRKNNPRTLVKAGSIGIAGEQTGIYPINSPGGWQLIAQTPLQLFDVEKENPCPLSPGDEVQFIPISLEEFNDLFHQNSLM